MPHSTPISYSLFPRDVEHEMPDIAKLQRLGSIRSLEQPRANTPLPACIRTQPLLSGGIESFPNPPELCIVKLAESEHRRAHSNPAGRPTPSRRSSFSRLRRTISAPINPKSLVVHGKWTGANETDPKNIASRSVRPSNPTTELQERNGASNGLQAPPTRSASTDLKNLSRNFIRSALSVASHDGRGAAPPPPPPPPPPAPSAHRPLSTLQEESPELEGLPHIALLPAIQLNDCKPWIPKAIESPTRANAVAPPPLKLRAPLKEGTTAPPTLTLSIPQKEQRSVPTPPSNPPTPSRPISRHHNKKHVRFAPTSPEIITPASIKALNCERSRQPQKTLVARHSSLQKHHPSWSAVFLLSAPSTANDNNNRPSSSPGPQPAPQYTDPKSILRRSSSFQNMRHDADDDDSDVEIKPLEDHVHLVINAAMEKNLTRLPRSKTSAHFRKNNPLPALPALAETPPTPTHNLNYNYNPDHASRHTHHAPVNFPQRPPSPPEPLTSRKFRHPVVISHPPSPPSSSASSRDASPASSRSSSSEREGSPFRTFTLIEPLRYSSQKAGKKEERIGRAQPERVT